MAAVIARGLQSVVEQTPSGLANCQWQAALRPDGRCDLDHAVSILIWPSEEACGARLR
jgi:hypothetical protein